VITDLDVALLRAYWHLYDAAQTLDAAQQGHEAARVRYFTVLDQVQAQDREQALAQQKEG
jgi:hypothetical protein